MRIWNCLPERRWTYWICLLNLLITPSWDWLHVHWRTGWEFARFLTAWNSPGGKKRAWCKEEMLNVKTAVTNGKSGKWRGRTCLDGKGTGSQSWMPEKNVTQVSCCENANILPGYLNRVQDLWWDWLMTESLGHQLRWEANSQMWRERTEKQKICKLDHHSVFCCFFFLS